MIVGVAPVEQHGLFDQPLPEHLRAEVDVFLGAGGTQRDVMKTLDSGHVILPSRRMLTPLNRRVNGISRR